MEGAWQGHRSLGRVEYEPFPGGGRTLSMWRRRSCLAALWRNCPRWAAPRRTWPRAEGTSSGHAVTPRTRASQATQHHETNRQEATPPHPAPEPYGTESKGPLHAMGRPSRKTPAGPKPPAAPKPAVYPAMLLPCSRTRRRPRPCHTSRPAHHQCPSSRRATARRRTERIPTSVTGTRPSRTGSPRRSPIDVRACIGPKQLHWTGTRGPKRRTEERDRGRISASSC